MSWPSIRIWPASGLRRPSVSLSRTDLPVPVTPSRKSVSPRPSLKETPSKTSLSPKEMETLRNSMAGAAAAEGIADTLCLSFLREPDPDQEAGDEGVKDQDPHRGHHDGARG